VIDISEPNGWIIIPLKDMNDKLVRTFMLQIAVLQNHQQVEPYSSGIGTHTFRQVLTSNIPMKIIHIKGAV